MSTWTDSKGRQHVGLMVERKRIHRVLPPGASASDAKRVAAELRLTLTRSKKVNIPGDPPMSGVLALYEQHAQHLRSAATSVHHVRRLGPWAEKYKASQAREFAAHVIKDMLPAYAPATINRSLATAKKGLALAWESNLTSENYGLRIKTLKVNNARETYLTIKQVQQLADCCSEQVRAAIWVGLYTGCRRGEVLAIQQSDIGPDSITIQASNTKTLRSRTIPIVAPLRPWLACLPIKINFEGLKSGFRRGRIAAGMPDVTFHDLRRSCGTLMIQAGVDLYVVSRILGHSTVQVTQSRYAHMQVDQLRIGLDKTFG